LNLLKAKKDERLLQRKNIIKANSKLVTYRFLIFLIFSLSYYGNDTIKTQAQFG
jgi:hypothetical protein